MRERSSAAPFPHHLPRRRLGIVAGLLVVVPLVLSAATGVSALAGAPLGLLLGFFLARGDLCCAAAIGRILALRDGRKLFRL